MSDTNGTFLPNNSASLDVEWTAPGFADEEDMDVPSSPANEETAPHEKAAADPPARPPPLVTVSEVLLELPPIWERNEPPTSTGFRQLDHMLSGGLRAGNVLAFSGAAKAGKSALVGQIAYEAGRVGALLIYASIEMTRLEIVSRWIVRQAFSQPSDPTWGDRWPLSYGDVLYGQAWRGDGIDSESIRKDRRARLERAMSAIDKIGSHLFVEHLRPGSTPETLREVVTRARSQCPGETLAVLVLDPIQRLYSAASGQLAGRALDSLNANETERVGMVAQQLKTLADDDNLKLAILFTSDTTKAAVASASSSSTSLRGSYQLNHIATSIFGLHTAPDLATLGKRLKDGGLIDDNSPVFDGWAKRRFDEVALTRDDAQRFGARIAFIECSGNRAGPAENMALTFVPGAMAFFESLTIDLEDKETKAGVPSQRPKRSTNDGAKKNGAPRSMIVNPNVAVKPGELARVIPNRKESLRYISKETSAEKANETHSTQRNLGELVAWDIDGAGP